MAGNQSSASSYFLDQRDRRKQPLNPNNASLNETLQTQYLDLDDDDDSFYANITRSISTRVGACCKPKQVLGLLRVLKAITLSFLILNILANLTYIVVELAASEEVKLVAGGSRDLMLRLYGLGFSFLGLAVELDYAKVVRKFSGLKGFLPRALLYFFIAQITFSQPSAHTSSSSSDQDSSNAVSYDDDANDDAAAGDDAAAANDDGYSAAVVSSSQPQMPSSAVGFQRVTSFVL